MADDPRSAFVRAMVNEGTSDDDIQAALKVYDAKHPPVAGGTSSGALGMLADVGTGVLKGAAHTVLGLGEAVGSLPTFSPTGTPQNFREAVDQLYGMPGLSRNAFQQANQQTAYANLPQRIGGGIETAAEFAMPVGQGAKAAAEAIPTTAKAGKLFQEVMGAAKNVPVDLTEPGNVALRIADLAQHGGGTQWGPAPVRQFIQWATNPDKPQMTYDVARDFASNISRLSAKDMQSIPPSMMREIQNLRVTLNQAVGQAAARAGKGAEYVQAMNDYAKAMRLRGMMDDAISTAQKYGPGVAAGTAALGAWHQIYSLLGQ